MSLVIRNIPRSIAIDSQINQTQGDLGTVSQTPLHGAAFSFVNGSANSSSHLITVISKDMTAPQAEELQHMMTHN